jgi:hypothetical protein
MGLVLADSFHSCLTSSVEAVAATGSSQLEYYGGLLMASCRQRVTDLGKSATSMASMGGQELQQEEPTFS